MDGSTRLWLFLLFAPIRLVLGQGQQCYIAAGAQFRAPDNVIPCSNSGPSACCYEGDTCLSGNACYNYATGDLYQLGCTDETYSDSTCPYKCGWDPDKSPWTALEYCDEDGVEDTWVCHSPESCGCDWTPAGEPLVLPLRGCQAMGSDARVALYAPASLAPWVSLPTSGGTTAYYSTYYTDGSLTWVSTAIKDYTPTSIGPYTTYDKAAPTEEVVLFPGVTPAPSTGVAHAVSVTPSQAPPGSNPSSGSSVPPSTSSSSSSSPSTSPPTSSSQPGSTTTTSSTTASTSPTSTSSPSLTTGAKVGIGVGVAGGVCLLAAIAIFSVLFRRRRGRSSSGGSNGGGPDEKYSSWQGQPYPPGGSPHGYHYNQSYQYQGVPAMIHEATYSPEDERTVQKRMSPLQAPPPVEMEGEHMIPEMESRSPSRPRQNYEETDIAKQNSQRS